MFFRRYKLELELIKMVHTTAELLEKITHIIPATPVDLSGIQNAILLIDAKNVEQDGRLDAVEGRVTVLEDITDKTVTALVPDAPQP